MRRSLVAVTLAALALPLLVACGDDDASKASSTPTSSATSTDGIDQAAAQAQPYESSSSSAKPSESAATTGSADCNDKKAKEPTASKQVGSDPSIEIPDTPPPCELVVTDLVEGEGKAVTDVTKTYEWNYEGVSWSTGEVFDSSFERGAPAPFALEQVISGWTEGLQGMKPGGRRMLVIPPDQAYGDTPQPGSGIAPGETLVFVVDLVGPAQS